MNKIHEKIMRTDYAKCLKRLIILAVCVLLLGGGISAAMLAPQIGEIASGIRQREQNGEESRGGVNRIGEDYPGDTEQTGEGGRESVNRSGEDPGENRESAGDSEHRGDREEDGREEHDFLENMTITKPAVGAVITLGITVLCGFLFLLLFWFLVAAWLYQAAVCSGMNGLIWLLAGLAGNAFGVVAFLLVRSFIRIKCPSCGSFLPVKAQYCSKCGAAMNEKCGNCGEGCSAGDKFCRACGTQLHENKA